MKIWLGPFLTIFITLLIGFFSVNQDKNIECIKARTPVVLGKVCFSENNILRFLGYNRCRTSVLGYTKKNNVGCTELIKNDHTIDIESCTIVDACLFK